LSFFAVWREREEEKQERDRLEQEPVKVVGGGELVSGRKIGKERGLDKIGVIEKGVSSSTSRR